MFIFKYTNQQDLHGIHTVRGGSEVTERQNPLINCLMSKYRVENMKKVKSKGKGKDKRKTTKLASVMAESIMITREDRRHIRFMRL